jgi:hypothetical protein
MDKAKKLMIVVWKWRKQKQGYDEEQHLPAGKNHDELPVTDEPYYWLIRYDPDLTKINETSAFIAAQLERFPGYSVKVFLHRNHGYTGNELENLKSPNAPFSTTLFGNSSDHLYMKPNSRYGLLTTDGYMNDRSLGISACMMHDGKLHIKKEHFDSVWNYYEYHFKRRTFKLKETFVQVAIPALHVSVAPELLTFLREKLEEYQQNIRPGANGEWLTFPVANTPDKQQQVRYPAEVSKFIRQLKDRIAEFLAHTTPQKEQVLNLRDAFDNLLDALPENIYDSNPHPLSR